MVNMQLSDYKKFETSSQDFGYYRGVQKLLLTEFIQNNQHKVPLFEIRDGKYNVENFAHHLNTIETLFTNIGNLKLQHKLEMHRSVTECVFSCADIFVGLVLDKHSSNIHFNAYSSNKNILESVYKIFTEIKEKVITKENIYVMTEQKGQLGCSSISNKKFELEEGNYNSETIEDFKYIRDEYNKEKPFGRISIFTGPAGTGKTHLVKSLATCIENCNTIFIPIGLAPYLDKPSFMDFLLTFKEETGPDRGFLFIIEDADQILIDRAEGNYSLLSAFLNFTDGIIGDCLNVRFLATTNSDFLKIDAAFKRSGRLLRYSNVGLLEPKKAEEVYHRLTKSNKTYAEAVALSDVYADSYSKMNGVTPEKKKQSLGFGGK